MYEQTYGRRGLPTPARVLSHWIVLLVCLGLGTGLGALYSASSERTYTASATVLLNPLQANSLSPEAASGGSAQLNIALETEAEIVASPVVAEAVSDRLDRLVPADGESLSVHVPTGTQMIRISFTSTSPDRAAQGAQTFAEAFLDYRQSRTVASRDSSLVSLRSQLDDVEKSLRQAISESGREGSDSFASRQVDLLTDRLAVLSSNISTTEALATDPGRVLGPAEAPTSANEMSPALTILLGAVAGLLLGAGLAWYLEWRKDTVRPDETVDVAGVPVFASVGPRARDGGTASPSAREAFRRLRVGVVTNATRPHVLAVASLDGQGSSGVAARLADMIAEATYDVALVASDPDDRAYEAMYGVADDAPGLSDLLAGTEDGSPHDIGEVHAGVRVVPVGRDPYAARDLYAGQRFREVVASLRETHDYVIMAAAGAGTADGDAVISVADSLLIVLTPSRTTHQQVVAALERCEHLGITVMGAVNVAATRRRARAADRR